MNETTQCSAPFAGKFIPDRDCITRWTCLKPGDRIVTQRLPGNNVFVVESADGDHIRIRNESDTGHLTDKRRRPMIASARISDGWAWASLRGR